MPKSILWLEHTVNDQWRVRSSWFVEVEVDAPVVARLAVVFVECHIVLEELEPVEGRWSQTSGRVVPVEWMDKEL
jgi:hypothetical protein